MPEQLGYTERYNILKGRTAFANYYQRQQLINNNKLIGLNISQGGSDSTMLSYIQEGEVNTTPTQVAGYLSELNLNPPPLQSIPSAPTSISVIPGNTSLRIFFVPGNNRNSPITNYQYSIDGGSTFITVSPAQITSPITINGLTNGTVYTVYLRAVNSVGAGESSASIIAAPIPNTFDPTLIAGIGFWLNSQDSTTVILQSGQVSVWNDSSANRNNYTASPTGIITYDQQSSINNRPAINFKTATPTVTSLSRRYNITPFCNEIQLFMVVQQTGQGIGNSDLFYTQNSDTFFDLFTNSTTGLLTLNSRTSVQSSTGINIISTPPRAVLIRVLATSPQVSAPYSQAVDTVSVYVNGSITATNSVLGIGTNFDSILNWTISGGAFKGYIGEVVSYECGISDADQQKVEGYLAWKWGLQSQLPMSHPYMHAPPS